MFFKPHPAEKLDCKCHKNTNCTDFYLYPSTASVLYSQNLFRSEQRKKWLHFTFLFLETITASALISCSLSPAAIQSSCDISFKNMYSGKRKKSLFKTANQKYTRQAGCIISSSRVFRVQRLLAVDWYTVVDQKLKGYCKSSCFTKDSSCMTLHFYFVIHLWKLPKTRLRESDTFIQHIKDLPCLGDLVPNAMSQEEKNNFFYEFKTFLIWHWKVLR